jgi:hypothetical protein
MTNLEETLGMMENYEDSDEEMIDEEEGDDNDDKMDVDSEEDYTKKPKIAEKVIIYDDEESEGYEYDDDEQMPDKREETQIRGAKNLKQIYADGDTISCMKHVLNLSHKELENKKPSPPPPQKEVIDVDSPEKLQKSRPAKEGKKGKHPKKKKTTKKKKKKDKKKTTTKKKKKKKKGEMKMDYGNEYDDDAEDNKIDKIDEQKYKKQGTGWNNVDDDYREGEEEEDDNSISENDDEIKEEEERRKKAVEKKKKTEAKKKKKSRKIKLKKKGKQVPMAKQYYYEENEKIQLKILPGMKVVLKPKESPSHSLQYPNLLSCKDTGVIKFVNNDGREIRVPVLKRGKKYFMVHSSTNAFNRLQCPEFDIEPIKKQFDDWGQSKQRDAKSIHSYYEGEQQAYVTKRTIKLDNSETFEIPFRREVIKDNDDIVENWDENYEEEYLSLREERIKKTKKKKKKKSRKRKRDQRDDSDAETEEHADNDDDDEGDVKMKDKEKPPKKKKRKVVKGGIPPIVGYVVQQNSTGNYFNQQTLANITQEQIIQNKNSPMGSYLLGYVQNILNKIK